MTRAVYTKNILYMKCVYLFIEECPELQASVYSGGCMQISLLDMRLSNDSIMRL